MNLVSIIIPYYKKKKYIKKTINSIINQTYQNLEIIIIYDDPNTNDLDFIKYLKNLDSRIKLIINVKNIGAGLSRNKGIQIAKGKFIAFLDADDLWKRNKIETQLNYMKKNKLKISHTSYKIIDKKNKIIGKRKAKNFNCYTELLKSCDIGLSTVMIEKKILSKKCQFVELKTKEDFVLWLRILKRKIMIGSIDRNLTYWRKLSTSLSSSPIQKLYDGFNVYYRFMKFGLLKSLFYLFCLSINYLKK
mgnify:CR=1 FL=1